MQFLLLSAVYQHTPWLKRPAQFTLNHDY